MTVWLLMAGPSARSADLSAEDREFFEQKIRPVLVEHCYACHSEQAERTGQLKGGLRLDTRDGLLQGGDSGPAVRPGDPAESLLLQALRYENVDMPPKGRLPVRVIEDFTAWVQRGAPDPRVGGGGPRRVTIDIAAGQRHWAYQLPRHHGPPNVVDRSWCLTEIDAFLRQAWEEKQLRPAAEASRPALARRLSYDLLGLPPDPEAVAEFVADTAPDAWDRLVDRWLASPRWGERWGRHWLDVARFAESLTLRGFVLPQAWRYRDYVIETWNADRPYDQFLQEQIAGDLLPAADLAARQRQCIATTYLALGNTNLEEQDKRQLRMDYVDEQLDVIGKGLLAQTLSCARCHDHKFDPIPTVDYYALAGIFRSTKALEHANVSKWLELPLPLSPADEEVHQAHEARLKVVEAQLKTLREQAKVAGAARPGTSGGAIAPESLAGIVVDDVQARRVGSWKDSSFVRPYVGRGYIHDLDEQKGDKTVTFQPDLPQSGPYEVRLAYTAADNRSPAAPVTVFSADGEKVIRVDQRQTPPIDGLWISLGAFRFEANGQGFVMVSNEGTTGHVIVDAVQFLPLAAAGAPAVTATATTPPPPQGSTSSTAPTSPDSRAVPSPEALAREARIKEAEAELKRLTETGPQRPKYLSIREEDADEIGDTHVHIRGLVSNLGAQAPRGVLRVALYGDPPRMPERESGRRELAAWLASPQNPLPSRVLVNRVWHWLCGAGLVRTVDNFGTTGEPPSHPALLDDLTWRFVADGWSTKTLVRRIVSSRFYRLSSVAEPAVVAADPENRLLARAHRRRLDAECLLDTMLWVSGELDLTAGGTSFSPSLAADYGFQHQSRRRAVYWPVFRNVLPEPLEAFDFADPSLVTGRRSTSTVAPQALFLRNHPFVLDRSRAAARRLLREAPGETDEVRLDRACQLTLGRVASPAEREATRAFLASAGADPKAGSDQEAAWAQVLQALMSSLDFRYP
ncbi:MAG: DUF1553 domain-containing protein [Pirellulales bacterium]